MEIKKKIYTLSAIFSLTALAVIGFLVYPLLAGIKKDSEDMASQKVQAAVLSQENKDVEIFKKNYDAYKPNLDKFDQLFVDSKDPVDFIKFLEQQASEAGVTSDISLLSPSTGNNLSFIELQFSATGNYFNVLNFSNKIENGPYMLEVEKLIIGKSLNEKSVSKNVDAVFSIKVFTK